MTARIQERVMLPSFDDPILITAFTTPFKGGTTASLAVSYLQSQWDATLIAELEAEECYHFGRIRPQIVRNGNRTSVQWPTTQVFAANPPGANRTFLLLIGTEPTQNWQSFAAAVAQFAIRAGVRTAISLRSLPASVSHRHPAPVYGWYSDEGARHSFGLPEFAMQEGAADFGLTINACLQEAGCRTVDLFGLEPFYAPAMPVAQTALALIGAVTTPYGASFDAQELTVLVDKQDRAIEDILAASPQLREGVQAIENQGGVALNSGQQVGPGDQSTSGVVQLVESFEPKEIVEEVEAWLRSDGS